jgi:hypothetical protein
MITVVTTVKGGLGDPFALGGFRQLFPNRGGGLHVAAISCVGLPLPSSATGCGQGNAIQVVNELSVNVLGAAKNAQPWPYGRAHDAPADVLTPTELADSFCFLMIHGCFSIIEAALSPKRGQTPWFEGV